MDKVSLLKLFTIFAKLGAFTIGGGYAMLPLIEKELTDRGWISEEDIQELIVLAQSAPGILAVNIAIYSGHKLRGIKGSIIATLGAILPSFVIILLIAIFFNTIKDNHIFDSIFQFVRPVAIALILVPAVRMAQRSCKNWQTWAIALGSLLTITVLHISPVWIILGIIVISSLLSLLKLGKNV